jgi:uncharacterized membrane protein
MIGGLSFVSLAILGAFLIVIAPLLLWIGSVLATFAFMLLAGVAMLVLLALEALYKGVVNFPRRLK